MTLEQQASNLLSELLASGHKAKRIGKKIGKSSQWVGHYRSDSKFCKPMDPEIAQKILSTDWSTISQPTVTVTTATATIATIKNKKRPKNKYQTISDEARKVLQQLLAKGYSPTDLAERFDSRPMAIITYADDYHWRGVPWELATKLLELNLDTFAPPRG